MGSDRRPTRFFRLNQLSLRGTFWLGFGGLLTILLITVVLSVVVLTYYSHSFERLFHENYDSVVYCDEMKEALDGLNYEAERLMWESGPANGSRVGQLKSQFSDNSRRQRANCFLYQEDLKSDAVIAAWTQFRARFDQFLAAAPAERPVVFRNVILPDSARLRSMVQEIKRMNLLNMVAVDGQVRRNTAAVRTALLVLAVLCVTLTAVFVGVIGPSMLRPLSALTRSAQRIADGQLDLSVEIATRDEVGKLGAAFNVMAERLREFKRLDLERLARSEQTTQMAVDSLPDAVAVLNRDGQIELANRAARERFGIIPGDSTERPAWMMDLHKQVMNSGLAVEPLGYRSAIQRFDGGEERFYLPHATPLRAGDGRVVGVTAILSDVTKLKESDEAKSNLVSTVSHELKTPLTSIRMATFMMADQESFGPLNENQLELLKTARENTERLYRTVDNLLGIGRMDSGRAPLKMQRIPAAEIVWQSVDPLRPMFEARNIDLYVAPPPEQNVLADPHCVGYALTNLLTNAAKYAPSGSRVEVCCEARDEFVEFSVRDNGPGIDPQHVPHLFERFYRVTSNGTAGAGLGLAIARDVVEAHGGEIAVETAPDRGATFHFSLRSA